MKLPIQAAAVFRELSLGTLTGSSPRTTGLVAAGLVAQGGRAFVDCSAVGNCPAWQCGDGCTCGTCQWNGVKYAGTCAC